MARRARRFRYLPLEVSWFRLVRRGRDPLDFARTRNAGGRYNAPGRQRCLYFGDQPATCLLEVLVHAYELPPSYDLVEVEVALSRVVDLVSSTGRKAAKVSLEALVAPPDPIVDPRGAIIGTRYGVTWELGELAAERGADALLVPAAALPVQSVLVAFDRPDASLTIRERRAIPADPRMHRLLGG